MGISGEIVPTPGHSDDSISVVLDDGSAFTGDLPPLYYTTPDSREQVAVSWRFRGMDRYVAGSRLPGGV